MMPLTPITDQKDGVITVHYKASDGRAAAVADFWVKPLIDGLGMDRTSAVEWQKQFCGLLLRAYEKHFTANLIAREKVAEMVAKRLLSEMEDYGGIEEFCEKLAGFPEQYATDLAFAAIDNLSLGGLIRAERISGSKEASK